MAYKSAIAFGLVYVPITLHSCIKDNDIGFNLLYKKTGERIRYKKTCENCPANISQDDIIKGFEYEKDKYVTLSEKEINNIKSEKDKNINIEEFVKLNEIDPIYYDRAFYVVPTGADNAFKLLLKGLGDDIKGDSSLKLGTTTGIAVVNVSSAPVTVVLTNTSNGIAYFSTCTPVKAMLSVIMEELSGTSETMYNFQCEQLTNILTQVIEYYPTNTISLFVRGLYYVIGTPTSLYSSSVGSPGLFIMTDEGDIQAIPLNMITGVYMGDAQSYNPAITYLTPSTPFPPGWDTNVVTAVYEYLPVGTACTVVFSVGNSRNGFIYKNEYGMVVVTADMDGAEPTFIPATEASIIITTTPTAKKISKSGLVRISE